MPPAQDNPFVTFGPAHLAAMGAVVLVSGALPLAARLARSAKLTWAICIGLSAVLVGNELVTYVHDFLAGPLMAFLRNSLPLHICGMGTYLTAWALLRRSRRVFEVAYFWGLGGSLQAVLTPNLAFGWPSYYFVRFFITHGGIVAGVVFAVLALRLRPSRGAVWRVLLITNGCMAVVAAADWLLGANYMFLCRAPAGESPFFFLPWPWYLLVLEAAGLGISLLLYLPFWLLRRRGTATRLGTRDAP